MNDIVIPYIKNSSGELEACLALINKNFPHRNIHVVEQHDRSPYRYASHIDQIMKLKWAIDNLDLTDDFYLFNDDFFVLNPVPETQYAHRGTLDEHIASRHSRDSYTRAIIETRDRLGSGLSYELHIPFLFNKEKLHNIIQELETSIEHRKCPLIRSYYGNTYDVGGECMDDVKNVKDFESKTYLSTTELSFKRQPIGEYIRSKI